MLFTQVIRKPQYSFRPFLALHLRSVIARKHRERARYRPQILTNGEKDPEKSLPHTRICGQPDTAGSKLAGKILSKSRSILGHRQIFEIIHGPRRKCRSSASVA